MPIEIKELHIRVTVNAPDATAQPTQQLAAPSATGGGTADREALLAECVEQERPRINERSE